MNRFLHYLIRPIIDWRTHRTYQRALRDEVLTDDPKLARYVACQVDGRMRFIVARPFGRNGDVIVPADMVSVKGLLG